MNLLFMMAYREKYAGGKISGFLRHSVLKEAQKAKLLDNEEQLRVLSIRDPLTGLFNRRYMKETLEREIERVLRNKQSLGIIIVI